MVKTATSGTQSQIETKSSYSQSAQASVKSTGSQSQIETKSKSSQSHQIFDMTVDDNMSKVKQDIQSVEDTLKIAKIQKEKQLQSQIRHNLHEPLTDSVLGFVSKMAGASSSSASIAGFGH